MYFVVRHTQTHTNINITTIQVFQMFDWILIGINCFGLLDTLIVFVFIYLRRFACISMRSKYICKTEKTKNKTKAIRQK